MRITALIILLTFKTLAVTSQSFDQRLSEVEKVAQYTNSLLNSFKSIKLESHEFMEHATDGGAELTGYFKNDQIQKIELSVGLSFGMEKFEFYYQNAELIYVKEMLRQFAMDDSTGGFNYSETKLAFRGQYIFKDSFDLITLGHNRFEDDEIDPELTLRQEAELYKKKLLTAYKRH